MRILDKMSMWTAKNSDISSKAKTCPGKRSWRYVMILSSNLVSTCTRLIGSQAQFKAFKDVDCVTGFVPFTLVSVCLTFCEGSSVLWPTDTFLLVCIGFGMFNFLQRVISFVVYRQFYTSFSFLPKTLPSSRFTAYDIKLAHLGNIAVLTLLTFVLLKLL